MAPTRPNSKKSKSKPRSSLSTRRKPSVSKPPRLLIADATTALEQGDALGALAFAKEALTAIDDDSDHPYRGAVRSLMGEIHIELGDPCQAQTHLKLAVEADPDGALPEEQGGGVEKFLYLAQLSESGGKDSVAWFERGAAALRTHIAELEQKIDAAATAGKTVEKELLEGEAEQRRQKLAEILCAVAEVYMTDLSWEPDCEDRCERLVTEATMLAPSCADVWQTLASVRVSQNRGDDAKAALERSLAAWEDLAPGDQGAPEFPVRVSLVRLLLTVGLLEKAVEVAERLVLEDDQSVEVWYLGGWGLYLTGVALKDGGELENWKAYWTSSQRWLGRCLRLFQMQEYEDERLQEHATELLAGVTKEIGEAPEDEDEWDDTDGEEGDGDQDGDEDMK